MGRMHLVELEFGDRMDEAAEKEAYSGLARYAVRIDTQSKDMQSPSRAWILAGFEAGTEPYDTFSYSYSAAYTELALRPHQREI